MQYIKQSFISLTVCLVLLAGVNIVFGWSTPSNMGYSIQNNTPTGNVATPLNIGVTGQSKSGGLYLGAGLGADGFGLIVDKKVRFTNFLSCQTLGTDSSGNITCAGGCTPNCAGKVCGDNGCGGSCGSCQSGYSCTNGSCVLSCSNDCSLQGAFCEGNAVYNCGYYDSDLCLDKQFSNACNYSCSGGVCQPGQQISCITQGNQPIGGGTPYNNCTQACAGGGYAGCIDGTGGGGELGYIDGIPVWGYNCSGVVLGCNAHNAYWCKCYNWVY